MAIHADLTYVSLQDMDLRRIASEDPRVFLQNFPKGAVLEKVQPQNFPGQTWPLIISSSIMRSS